MRVLQWLRLRKLVVAGVSTGSDNTCKFRVHNEFFLLIPFILQPQMKLGILRIITLDLQERLKTEFGHMLGKNTK